MGKRETERQRERERAMAVASEFYYNVHNIHVSYNYCLFKNLNLLNIFTEQFTQILEFSFILWRENSEDSLLIMLRVGIKTVEVNDL